MDKIMGIDLGHLKKTCRQNPGISPPSLPLSFLNGGVRYRKRSWQEY
jgi:hypothetical protein